MRRDKLMGSLKALEAHRQSRDDTPPSPAPAGHAPAVSSVAESIKRLGASSARDVLPDEIMESRFSDRLDVEEGLEDLVSSIERSGQQLPVLLRRAPRGAPEGKLFEVIYGRRRIAACRKLGRAVRAHVTDFDDREALVAQGLENAARLENSFIERARFAAQLEAAGYQTADICETLGVDGSGLSRMRAVIRSVPEELIQAIGPAHQSGRRPWLRLGEILGTGDAVAPPEAISMIEIQKGSDERLAGLVARLESGRKSPQKKPRQGPRQREISGKRLSLAIDQRRMTVKVTDKRARDFLPWLDERMDELYSEWLENNKQSSEQKQ